MTGIVQRLNMDQHSVTRMLRGSTAKDHLTDNACHRTGSSGTCHNTQDEFIRVLESRQACD